jgi:hypothetical protein
MRRFAFALLLLITAVLPLGCTGDGVAYSHRERQENFRRSWDMDQRMLNDDLDYLMLRDQPSHLSRWSVD